MKTYNYLNLNQKMIKIRKKIPVLIKKRYNEDVDYDFVKIDDIYELLTPALNKYGVDFEIISEKPTQRDAEQHLIFLREDSGYWRYEADLELAWINADCPEERKITQIHAIGTHEVPEKAKGTAWTYALKYYLLNRFSIKQGGFEDPDMLKHPGKNEKSGEEDNAKKDTGSSKEKATKVKKEEVATKEEGLRKGGRDGNGSAGKQHPMTVPSNGKEEEEIKGSPKETVQGNSENPDKEEKLTENTKTEINREKTEEVIPAESQQVSPTDGFEPADTEEVPFFEETEEEFVDNIREAIEDSEAGENDAIEKARNVKCDFGLYSGKTLGEMMESPKGRESVKWIAQRYRGANTTMKEAAKRLINELNSEKRAA